jgi:hypothetical protein
MSCRPFQVKESERVHIPFLPTPRVSVRGQSRPWLWKPPEFHPQVVNTSWKMEKERNKSPRQRRIYLLSHDASARWYTPFIISMVAYFVWWRTLYGGILCTMKEYSCNFGTFNGWQNNSWSREAWMKEINRTLQDTFEMVGTHHRWIS